MKSITVKILIALVFSLCDCTALSGEGRVAVTAKANLLTLSPNHKDAIKVFFTYRDTSSKSIISRDYTGTYGDASYLLIDPDGNERNIQPEYTGRVTDRIYTSFRTYQYFKLPEPLQIGTYTIIESGKMSHVTERQISVEYSSSPASFTVAKETISLSELRLLADKKVAGHFEFELKNIDWIIRDESPSIRVVAAGLSPSEVPEKYVPMEKRKKLEYGGYRVRLKFNPAGTLIDNSITPMYWHVD